MRLQVSGTCDYCPEPATDVARWSTYRPGRFGRLRRLASTWGAVYMYACAAHRDVALSQLTADIKMVAELSPGLYVWVRRLEVREPENLP